MSVPPTSAPSAMRHVLFVSPSQPLNVLPSKTGVALAASAAWAAITASERKMTASDFFMIGALCCHPRISVAARPVERGFLTGFGAGAWQFRWDFSLGGVIYLSSWGNIWFQRPLRWRVASARKASSPLRLQNWPVSLKRRWYWEQVDSIAPEPTGWPRAFPLL